MKIRPVMCAMLIAGCAGRPDTGDKTVEALLVTRPAVALHGDHPDLPPCEHECTHRYETCVREIAVSGKSLLDCINAYYDCANRCDEDE